jgi:hypothetical protein
VGAAEHLTRESRALIEAFVLTSPRFARACIGGCSSGRLRSASVTLHLL